MNGWSLSELQQKMKDVQEYHGLILMIKQDIKNKTKEQLEKKVTLILSGQDNGVDDQPAAAGSTDTTPKKNYPDGKKSWEKFIKMIKMGLVKNVDALKIKLNNPMAGNRKLLPVAE